MDTNLESFFICPICGMRNKADINDLQVGQANMCCKACGEISHVDLMSKTRKEPLPSVGGPSYSHLYH